MDHEILELVLMMCLPRKDVKPIGKALLERCGDISGMPDADMEALMEVEGVGQEAATVIKIIKNLLEVYMREKVKKKRDVLDDAQSLEAL